MTADWTWGGLHFTRPEVVSLLRFEGADLFDEDLAGEHIRFTDRIEALSVLLDGSDLPDCGDVAKFLETETVFLTLTAWRRMAIPDHERSSWAKELVEALREKFGEEHSDPDSDDRLGDSEVVVLEAKMHDVVSWYLGHAKVYPCEQLRSWTFDNADIRELVEQLRPDWLKP